MLVYSQAWSNVNTKTNDLIEGCSIFSVIVQCKTLIGTHFVKNLVKIKEQEKVSVYFISLLFTQAWSWF